MVLFTAAAVAVASSASSMQALLDLSRTNATTTVSSCDPSSLISKHEGSRTCSYTDTTGHKTVGVGFNMDAVSSSKWASICSGCPDYNSVYSGAKCLSSSNINTLLQYSLRDAKAEAARVVSNYNSMCCNVQNVVTDMTFNLGSLSGFPTLVSYFEKDDWADAASDMKGTLWCRQVGSRCTEDASMVASGCGGPAPPPSPSGGCKACINGGGGAGCASKCSSCGSTCVNCVKGGGGKACASKCCDNSAFATSVGDERHHRERHVLEEAAREVEQLHHEIERLQDHEHHHHHRHGDDDEHRDHRHGDEHHLLDEASYAVDELHRNIETLEDHEHHHHRRRDDEEEAVAAPASERFLEAKKAAHAAGRKALRGAARVPSFVEDPTNGCSNKGTCGNAYQACCIAFQLKGFPCGCHLTDGTGKVGANCGDCGTTFGACCIAESCKCDIA